MTRERFLTDQELERLMRVVRERRHVNQPRDHALLALLANTGMRPEEARALRRCDVRPSARPPQVHLARVKRDHGPDPINTLVLHKSVAAVLARHLDAMSSQDPGALLFPFTKRQSRRIFHYYAGKAGLSRTLKLYSLRHSVGMRLWRYTRDLRLIQGVMGHVRLKASACYSHIGPEQIAAACAAVGTAGA
jgi:site-specific recombinase XerD